MVSNLYTLYQVAVGSSVFKQIQSQQVTDGIDLFRETGGGIVDPSWTAIMSVKPVLSFTTQAVAAALTIAGLNGLAIPNSTNPLKMWFQKYAQGGTRQTGDTGFLVEMGYGMLVPTRLQAQQGQAATLEYEAHARTNDGTTAPIAKTALQTLPNFAAASEAFTCGPISLNGTTKFGIRSIDFGPDIQLTDRDGDSDGEPYLSFLAIETRKPVFRIRGKDIAMLSSPVAITSTTKVYYRKMSQGGTRVAAGTGQHVSLTIAAGTAYTRDISAQTGQSGEVELVIEPHYDGTNSVVAIATNATIPTS